MKIDKMTAEQEQQLVDYRQEWLNIGRSITPINLVQVEQAVADLYGVVLDKPKPLIIYCQSPWQMCIMPEVFKQPGKFEGIWSNLRSNLWSNLRSNLGSNLWSNLGSNLESNLWSNLGSNLGSNLWSNLGSNLESNYYWLLQGAWGSYWANLYDFAERFIRPGMYSKEDRNKLTVYLNLAKSVAGYSAYDGVCFISDRPVTLTTDDQGRLHNESSMSLEYSDGYGLYMWHGIVMNNRSFVITNPEQITIQNIEAETNAEIKRVMMERFGWDRFLRESNAEIIDEYLDQLGHPVKLYRKELGQNFDEPLVMIEVTNSTIEGIYSPTGQFIPDLKDGKTYHKKYMFAVPPDIQSAKKAHAWICGVDADEIEFVEQT